ncbi:MAG: MBOAT family protein, partial [bacterium]|nr:MBOAT family protein [bacterium]
MYTSLLLVSIAINYFCGLLIHKAKTHKKAALVLGVAANLSILGFFKYAGFIVENVNVVLVSLGFSAIAIPRIYLPLGISFFTFQAISYLVDLYREQAQVQRNPLNLALYISLFPQLIAGPIVRYTQIADALENRIFKMTDFLEGIERLVIGLAKKLILADTLALAADRIFLLKTDHLSSPIAWFGILCFTFQIYFDFSGYSDMA